MDNPSDKKKIIRTESNYLKLLKQGIISREAKEHYKNQGKKIIRTAKRKNCSEFSVLEEKY